MNAFFDGYVHAKTNLKEFVDQFDNALRKKIENENGADFQSFNFKIPVVTVSPFETIFQELYTNSKFREVQQEVMGIVGCLPILQQKNDVIATYHVEDEIHVDGFIKEVTYSVYFDEAECEVKCSCGLFEMRGILCRHIFATLKVNRVRMLPKKYILDRWRKDIKRKYTLISSSFDVVDARPDVSRYSRIMKICGDVASNAASSDEHAQDMIDKLHAMNEVYLTNKSPIQTCSNVAIQTADTTTCTSSKKVLSPLVVRGKGRPPSLRKASIMEKVCKPKTRKATQKGKHRQMHGRDIEVVDTRRNLFGETLVGTQESVPIQLRGNISEIFDSSGTQFGESMITTQESMHLGVDETQPDNEDGAQPDLRDFDL
ncbi:protein FAR-RED IMPAIRED RESPONSE 1-like [Juglans regia]|uniref:Protein FAR1-RELATED SEQUENCE n=1 Tax=Juglans regia TaxID=51240 RepID=A0A6P9EUB2_JUGRE|nr:protein FAR-RED IMPAIRED RESPONSE 1-like [Juglans regia]